MSKRPILAAGLAGVLIVAGLAACSSSGKSSTSAKSEIKLMVVGAIAPSAAFGGIAFPYGATGAKAAVAALNKSGGIDGHEIHLDVCDTKGDPNGSAQCGRTAIANKDIAVVGAFDPIGAVQDLAVLKAANIPYIGGLPTTYAELNEPNSFQFDPGPILSGFALVGLWQTSGCKTVSSILPANPGNDQVAAQEKALAATMGVKVSTQLVTPGIADIAPSLSTALRNSPDCFTYAGDGQTNVKYILAARKQGYQGKIITTPGSLTPQFLPPLGKAADGILAVNSTAQPMSGDPATAGFDKDMASYLDNDKSQIAMNDNEFAQDGWSSVQLVKLALTGAKTFTSQTLMQKIPTMCDVNVGNVYAHVDFCKPLGSNKTLSRVYNDDWQYLTIKDGRYVSDGVWHNLVSLFPKG
jgi:branched-chain amino acid transport system substrate-binding protein